MRTQISVQDWDPNKYLGKQKIFLEKSYNLYYFNLILVKISDYNRQMPSNLYLLLGDATLELVKKEIDKIRWDV